MGIYTYNCSVAVDVMIDEVMGSFKDGELASLRLHEDVKCLRFYKRSVSLSRNVNSERKVTSFKYSEFDGEVEAIKAVKEFRDREREENTNSNIGVHHLSLKIKADTATVILEVKISHGKKAYGVYIRVKDMADLRVAVDKGMKVIEAIRGKKYYTIPDFDKMEPFLEQLIARVNGVMQLYKVTVGGKDFNIIACGEDSAMNMLKRTMSIEMLESDVSGIPGIIDDDIDAEHY